MSVKRRRAIAVLVVFAVVAVIAAPKLLDLRRDSSGPAMTSRTDAAPRVRAHRVRPTELTERLSTTGTVRANEEVEIVSEISGKISSIHFDEGSRVSAGQLLLKIDDSELLAERQRALYRVELAERDEARQKQLLEDGVIAREAYDVALGELNVLRAELQLIEAQLIKTEIRAPFDGVIGLRSASPGSYLSSQTRIASLKDLDPVKLDFTVPEKYSGLMQMGDRISFTVGSSDHTFDGTVYAVEPGIDTSTRSLRVRARCPNRDGALIPGAFANVTLILQSVANALTVPSISVIPELGGKKVFVYEDGVAQPRPVDTGIRSDTEVQITSGLAEGDLVITTGLLQIHPGTEVEIEAVENDASTAP
jgi:membrane fusion protein (multidrug efflux system)